LTKNIIVDLGGVLLDIDFSRTHQAFAQLGIPNFAELYNQYSADPFFANFEKGKVNTADFFNKVREICHCPLTDDAIRNAWNALLIGFPPERTAWLLAIREKYNVFLFSNTNIIHYQWFTKNFYEMAGKDFNNCFTKAYYSHEMGLRKPDQASFQLLIDEQNLNISETLFIDDTLANVEAAKEMGFQVLHLVKPKTVVMLGL
jgi:FMN phosphatase YigB (HAD superfamily)